MLAQLHQANLFLVPLMTKGFGIAFILCLPTCCSIGCTRLSPALVADLHARASAWYEEAGQLADAIHHCLRAADHVRTAALLARVNALLARVRTDKAAALQMDLQAAASAG